VSPPRTRRFAAALAAVGVALTLAFAIQAYQRTAEARNPAALVRVNDFGRFLVMVPEFLFQHADYVNDAFPSPPLVMLLLAPFTALPPPVAEFVWVVVKLGLVTLIFVAGVGMVRAAGVEPIPVAVALLLAAWIWPIFGDVQEGQTNLLTLAALVAGLRVLQRETPASQAAGGLLVALSICLKVTPLAFVPYLAWRRRWIALVATGAGILLWLVVVPGLALGFEQNLRWLGQWSAIMLAPYVLHGEALYVRSQSLGSVVTRLVRHVPAMVLRGRGEPVSYYANVVDLSAPLAASVVRALLAAIAVAGLVWARRPLPSLRSRRYLLECGAVAVFMLWASERTWVEHYVTLVLALFAAVMVASDETERPRTRRAAWVALALSAALLASTSDVARLFHRDGSRITKSLAVCFWASAALTAVLVSARGEPRSAHRVHVV
jgi:hypothetical protein